MEKSYNDYKYVVENNEIAITQYTGSVFYPVIPSVIDGVTVTTINEKAFANNSNIRSIEIPDTITSIKEGAFSGCELLSSINIPNTLTSLGEAVFSLCMSLSSIKVNNSHPVFAMIDGVLFNKQTKILLLYLRQNKQLSYSIPKGINTIADYAFALCDSLTTLEIHDSVTKIGKSAFFWCYNLTNLQVSDNHPIYIVKDSVLLNRKENSIHTYLCSKQDIDYSLPSDTLVIDAAAFAMGNLRNIEIPNSLTKIKAEAFILSNLESIDIPSSVTDIEDGAFAFCRNLKSIYISSMHANFAIIDGVFFDKIQKKLHTYISNSEIADYVMPQGINTIAENAFSGCEKLITVKIADTVNSISETAFNGCTNLEIIEIPKSVTYISKNAFSLCEKLILHVHKDSYAHNYVMENKMFFQLCT